MNAKTKSSNIIFNTQLLRVLRDSRLERRFGSFEDLERTKLSLLQADAAVGRVRIGARGGSAGDEPVWNEIAATNAKP